MLGLRGLAEHLIDKHPEHVNAAGGREMTVIHVAASGGYPDILSLLFDHGVDVNSRGKYGNTPLRRATWNTRLEAGQFLLVMVRISKLEMILITPY
jgi:ankyrin repeat protein